MDDLLAHRLLWYAGLLGVYVGLALLFRPMMDGRLPMCPRADRLLLLEGFRDRYSSAEIHRALVAVSNDWRALAVTLVMPITLLLFGWFAELVDRSWPDWPFLARVAVILSIGMPICHGMVRLLERYFARRALDYLRSRVAAAG